MLKKLLRSILVLLLIGSLLLGMAACGKSQGDNGSGNSESSSEMSSGGQSGQSESSGQSGSSDESTSDGGAEGGSSGGESDGTSEASEPEEEKVAVRELTCVSEINMIESVVVGVNDQAVMCCYVAGEYGAEPTIAVIDLKEDKILYQSTPQDAYGFPVGVRENGEIFAINYETGKLFVLSSDLQVVREIEVDVIETSIAAYSRSEDAVYVSKGGKMTRVSPEGEQELTFWARNWSKIISIDPIARTVLVQGIMETDIDLVAYRLFSFDGELLCAVPSKDSMFILAGDTLVSHYFDWETPDDVPDVMGYFTVANGWEPEAYAISKRMDFAGVSGTNLLAAKEDTILSRSEVYTDVFILDPADAQLLHVFHFEDSRRMVAAYDADNECFIFAMAGAGGGSILVVDPALLDMSMELETAEVPVYEEADLTAEMPEHLVAARTYADEIEQKYGVRILIGEEPKNTGFMGYDLKLTSGREDEEKIVTAALETLDDVLGKLPDGFIDFFKQDDGSGGLRFSFYDDILKQDSTFVAGGVTSMVGAWYNIAFDTQYFRESIFFHELWHAVENRCDGENAYIYESDWNVLNPEEFHYGYDFETYMNEENGWMLGQPDPDQVYFIFNYSTINDREDRATLIEELTMYPDAIATQYAFLETYPHLMAKIHYLEENVREVFGYVYWEVMMDQE